jgi:alpha-beta hydrolase superfamily lysophospholipase
LFGGASAVDVHETIENIRGADQQTLFSRWVVPNSPRALVLLVHGLSEHSGRYRHVMQELATWGFASGAFDQRGHGRSAIHPGQISSLNDLVADLRIVRSLAGDRFGKLPTFIWGHSMGGLVSALYLTKYQEDFDGAILASAAVVVPRRISKILVHSAPLLARIVPRLGLLPRGDASKMCNDPKFIERTNADVLTQRKPLQVGTGMAILQAMSYVQQHLGRVRLPVLVMHGTADQIVDVEASQRLYAKLGSEDKVLRLFSGFAHELHNDLRRVEVFNCVRNWIEARLPDVAHVSP